MAATAPALPATGSDAKPGPQRLAQRLAAVCAALALPALIAAGLDPRTPDGVGVWVKPPKFQLAFALHWLTLARPAPLRAPQVRPALASWLRLGGGVKSHAAGLSVRHRSITGGGLRVPHFVATHLMQALPALRGLLGKFVGRRGPVPARHLRWFAAAAGLVTTAWAMACATAGRPLLAT